MRDREGCLEGLFKLFLLTAAFDWWRNASASGVVAPALAADAG
jgi:hypothetical protein